MAVSLEHLPEQERRRLLADTVAIMLGDDPAAVRLDANLDGTLVPFGQGDWRRSPRAAERIAAAWGEVGREADRIWPH